MQRSDQAIIGLAALLAAPLWLVVGGGVAAAQTIPTPGLYVCTGGSETAAELNFNVGPGNIYTTKAGRRGVMTIHPLSGNVLFYGAIPQDSYEGRYSPGPPPEITLLPETGAADKETAIVCRMR